MHPTLRAPPPRSARLLALAWLVGGCHLDTYGYAGATGEAPAATSQAASTSADAPTATSITGSTQGTTSGETTESGAPDCALVWEELPFPATDHPAPYKRGLVSTTTMGNRVLAVAAPPAPAESEDDTLAETWAFDGAQWTLLDTSGSPPALLSARLGYDPTLGTAVLVVRTQTWTFAENGTNDGSWTLRHDDDVHRRSMSLAYVPGVGIVTFGGFDEMNTPQDGFFHWDGSAWQSHDELVRPPALTGAAMFYDSSAGLLVLHGGKGIDDLPTDETWTWDGHFASDWQNHGDVGGQASAYSAAAYHESAGFAAKFAGLVQGDSDTNRLFLYSGLHWREEVVANSPSARVSGTMASFDDALVVFGGGPEGGGDKADTWLLRCL